MSDYEAKYNNLRLEHRRLRRKYDDLWDETIALRDKLLNAEYRIKNELEPLVKAKNDSYDDFVSSGGTDECFSNGMSGNCGDDCTAHGSKPECPESPEEAEDVRKT